MPCCHFGQWYDTEEGSRVLLRRLHDSLVCCRYPEANLKDEQARTYLGQFGISGLLALEPLYILSGGQKSRVAIALMAYNNPHILVGPQKNCCSLAGLKG